MAAKSKPLYTIKFESPSKWWGAMWRGALPTGNGVIGASVQGGAGEENILINHNYLSWQGYTGVLPDVSEKLKDVRKQLDFGDFRKANEILPSSLVTKGYRPIASFPLPLCDLKITYPLEKPVKEYSRQLNMESGEIAVSYKDGSTRFERSLFVSRKQDIVVYEIEKTGPKSIDAEFSLDLHDRTNIRTPVAISKLPENATSKYENFFMYFAARNDNGTDFGAVAHISQFGGSRELKPNSIRIKGAEKVLVIVKVFIESQRDKEWKALRADLAILNKLTYDKLLKEHTAAHSKLMNSCELDLQAKDRDMTVDELMRFALQNGDVKPALLEKLWTFGRYLFISGCNETASILNPYGIWCGDYKAVSSSINTLGSTQMLYSLCYAGGLADFTLPIFDRLENVLDDLKKNASRLYNCRGIFVPGVTAPGSGLLGVIDPQIIHSTFVAGWLGQMFYDYYLFTQDIKFLKTRALPFMKEVALFYEEFFKAKLDGQYESYPSCSPNNTPLNYEEPGQALDIARNSTVDFAVAKELLTNLIKGSEECGVYKNEIDKWKDMLTRIPPYVITEDGYVKEYLDPKLIDNHRTRSINQLYGVWPGTEAFEKDPDLFKASLNTLRKRAVSGVKEHNVGSYVRFANTFARLGDGNNALEMINTVIRSGVMDNLITANNDWRSMGIGMDNNWATYQIRGNIGITSAVQEMLVSSREGLIKLCPAIPQDWNEGSISGINTRCGVEVEVSWNRLKKTYSAKLKAKKTSKFDIALPLGAFKVKSEGQYDSNTGIIKNVEIQNGRTITVSFSL